MLLKTEQQPAEAVGLEPPNKNKSHYYFCPILFNTLKEDYNIPISLNIIETTDMTEMEKALIVKAMKLGKQEDVTDVPFSADLLLKPHEYKALKEKEACHDSTLTPVERQRLWVAEAIERWKIKDPQKTLETSPAFYEKFIGPYSIHNKLGVYGMHKKLTRTFEAINEPSAAIHRRAFEQRMAHIRTESKDPNLAIYKDIKIKNDMRLINGIEFMDAIGLTSDPTLLRKMVVEEGTDWTIKSAELHDKIGAYLNMMDTDAYTALLSAFDMTKTDKDNAIVAADKKKTTAFCKNILESAFGFVVKDKRTNKKENKAKIVSCPIWWELKDKSDLFTVFIES